MKVTALTNKLQRGFTLVELLVVIAILGVLVAALLATLDPLEQIRKGNDSARLSIAREYQQAYTRFYANNGRFPWIAPSGGSAECLTAPAIASAAPAITGATFLKDVPNCNTALVTTGELKSSTLPGNLDISPNYLTITTSSNNDKVVVCFKPASKAQIAKANTDRTDTLGTATCTTGSTSPNQCYICVQ